MQTRFDADHVRKNCFFSYRGSAEPQTVRFRARWATPHPTLSLQLARPEFAVQPEAFVNILVNQLVWVHHREIPIARVSVQTS